MSTELAVRDEAPSGGLSLIEGPDPAGAVAYAAQVSTAIAGVLDEGNGYTTIQGKKHITIEGWQSLSAMTGHSVEVEWSRPIEGMENAKGVKTWEARAVVRDQAGRVVASGESMADPNEPGADRKWARGGNFSVRSMAQTRAMSRALASRLRYIVQLAGFSGTPAEEMSDEAERPDPLAIARGRWKVLKEECEVENDAIAAIVPDPVTLAADDVFAAAAYYLGRQSMQGEAGDDEPIDGEAEVVDEPTGDDAVAQQIFDEQSGRAADPDAGGAS